MLHGCRRDGIDHGHKLLSCCGASTQKSSKPMKSKAKQSGTATENHTKASSGFARPFAFASESEQKRFVHGGDGHTHTFGLVSTLPARSECGDI